MDHNLEKHICKTMAKTNTKGAIITWSSMTSMCRLSFYTTYRCTNSFFPLETVLHWKDWLVLLTNMFTNAWWLPCWDHWPVKHTFSWWINSLLVKNTSANNFLCPFLTNFPLSHWLWCTSLIMVHDVECTHNPSGDYPEGKCLWKIASVFL